MATCRSRPGQRGNRLLVDGPALGRLLAEAGEACWRSTPAGPPTPTCPHHRPPRPEQGHITDRYAKAIEHLGSETIDVRLGGIYTIERIAHDSPRVQDQATIVEVLSAFVRVHSDPVYRLRKDQPELTPKSKEHERELAAKHVEAERLPIDVQAALTVLGRLPRRASW